MAEHNINDVILIKGELERLNAHSKFFKETLKENEKNIIEIKSALIGNKMNGDKGIVFLISDIDKRVTEIERTQEEYKVYVNQMKWVGGIIISFIVGLMLLLVTDKKI